jgi:hypothetical protein
MVNSISLLENNLRSLHRHSHMQFSIQLSAYYPDKSYGGDRVYRDMLELAGCADSCG